MKKLFAIMLILVMVFSLAACGNSNEDEPKEEDTSNVDPQSVEGIQAAGEIVMYTNAEFPPFEYREGNDIMGVDVEIANEIAKDLGVKLTIMDVNFDSIVLSISSGKGAFGAAGMTVTPEREESVDFSTKYVTSRQYVIMKEDETAANLEDLAGYNIGVQTGTTGDFIMSDEVEGSEDEETGEAIEGALQNSGAQVQRYGSPILAAQDILSNRLDVVVVDELPAKNIVEANTGLKCIELLYADGRDTAEEYAICVAKGNTSLLEAINKTLDRLIAEGKIDEFVIKHMESGAVGGDSDDAGDNGDEGEETTQE